jgi:two-component system LytT family response regulator
MIRCLIVDDKPLAIDILKDYISKIPFFELVYSTRNPLEAIEYIHKNKVDLIFLDIQMPELNGIQFMKILNGKNKVILTTAYADYALEGYEHDVIDYLLKPVSFERFYKAVEKARRSIVIGAVQKITRENINESNAAPVNCIFVKREYRIESVLLETILYIKARQNYIAIVTEKEQIMSLQNIKSMEEKLPADKFARVHKSYIVSLDKINTIERSQIRIRNSVIPIGDSYRVSFFEKIRT